MAPSAGTWVLECLRLASGADVHSACQALFGNLGSHKLAPAVEARAEFLTAAVGEDGPAQLAQVHLKTTLSTEPSGGLAAVPV